MNPRAPEVLAQRSCSLSQSTARRDRGRWAWPLALLLASACKDPPQSPADMAVLDMAAVPPVSLTVDATGGSVVAPQLGGAALQVPAGALTQATPISLGQGGPLVQSGETALGPVVRLSPDGLQLDSPASLTLPYDLGALDPESELIIAATANGQRVDLEGGFLNVDRQARTVSVNISHFSDYQVITRGKRPPALNKDVDILFLIDNSPSMSPKQQALAQNIPRFIQTIEGLGINYHIGVTTSDVGTWVARGTPWGVSLGTCNSYEGDDGALQRVACNTRAGLSADAIAACQTLCPDPKFVPGQGQGYISKVNGVTNVPVALVPNPNDPNKTIDVGPANAFKCVALVGDAGCGVEGQLEGAKRAVDGHSASNAGFLRPNSLLAVVFITDEDDCSVQLGRRAEIDPTTQNCAAGDQSAPASCYNPDYRCLARDLRCDQPMNTAGTKTNCRERADSFLQSVDSYARFFAGLRPANRLLMSGIWALKPVDRGGAVVINYERAGTNSFELNRVTGAQATCVNAANPLLFGRPQLRLSRLARQFNGSLEVSICDTDSYPQALNNLAAAIMRKVL